MKKVKLLNVAAMLLVFAFAVAPGAQETSTPAERARWVEITHKLESKPLDESVDKEGKWAVSRISEVHDFHVLLCAGLLNEFNGMKYRYSRELTRQYMLATAAFMIENPDAANNHDATNLEAVKSVLKVYSAIAQQKPDATHKILDDLLQKQSQGKLPEYVQKKCHLSAGHGGI